jgi:HlyD family secretion protein
MASGTPVSFYRDLDLIAGSATVAGLGDAELLSRFALRRDATAEAAFEALVARHGPMVLATCRRSLRRSQGRLGPRGRVARTLAARCGGTRVAQVAGRCS